MSFSVISLVTITLIIFPTSNAFSILLNNNGFKQQIFLGRQSAIPRRTHVIVRRMDPRGVDDHAKQDGTIQVPTTSEVDAWFVSMKQWIGAIVVATTLWSSPAAIAPFLVDNSEHTSFRSSYNLIGVANAKDKASGSGSRVNKDPESLLRYGLPIQNKEVCQT